MRNVTTLPISGKSMTDGLPLPRFSLSLLGRFELSGPDGVVDLPSRKLAGLLAYLACTAPQPQPREKLSALLWGSHFDTQARQNLRQALFRLRKVLGQQVLESDGEVISLDIATVRCDVGRFRDLVVEGSRDALSTAADLYRGDLVDDIAIGEESWNEWLVGERERLKELALAAMVKLGEQELAAGHADHALRTGQRANALNNLREDAHRLIIRALAAAGRKAEALKYYDDLAILLKRELSTEPDAATRSLVAELRRPQQRERLLPAEETERPPVPADLPASGEAPGAARGGDASPPRPARASSLEQRQLTIMVCSMVGLAPPNARRDPEDIHDLISRFHQTVADTVARFDGFVAQYLGTGALVYFGYPVASEHDAGQAVRAGLAIVDAVAAMKDSAAHRASAGIATGLIVIGENPGPGDIARQVAIGETPQLAARLQAAASPGGIVIAESTRRLLGRMFDCRALPAIDVGWPQPAQAWQVRGEAAGIGRSEARRGRVLSPFVGRQEEIDLLLRRWSQARAGEGRVVLISGEPGIGKSRIAETLLGRLKGEPHLRLRYFCSPHHGHSPLYPVIAQIEHAAGFGPGSGDAGKLERLEAILAPRTANLPRDATLIAELLRLPVDGRYPALTFNPQQRREATLVALLDQVDGAAAQQPVVIVLEDAHWIDPTTLDLLDRMVARTARLPVLLIVTFRPEFEPAWIGEPHVSMLPLSRLGHRDGASMIMNITRDGALPDALVQQILSRADGVPLFIEELTHTLRESQPLREAVDHPSPDGAPSPLAVPMTLQASLVARLDRLGPVKEVAQVGAVIGREFSRELIAAVSALPAVDLDEALERLVASGLISRRGSAPDANYSFKHALIQDAAYVTMIRSRRRELHASIATVLVERFPALAESRPELVAHHFTEAGFAGEAVGYWRRAGQLASARSANREAVTSFERAVHLLKTQPETRETLEQAIDLRFELRAVLFQLGEFERIIGYLREAESQARALGDQRRLGQLSIYLCHNRRMAGELDEAIRFGRAAKAIAESLRDIPLQVTASLDLGSACVFAADYREAEQLLRMVLGWLDGDRWRERFGQTIFPAVAAFGYLSWIIADQGRFEEAIAQGEECARIAAALDHPYSLAYALWALARPHLVRGNFGVAAGLLGRGMAVSRQWNLTYLSLLNTAGLGYAYARSGRIAEGIAMMEQAMNSLEAAPEGAMMLPLCQLYLGEACIAADRFDDARALAERALMLSRQCGQRGYQGPALRLLGDVFARTGSAEQAERHYCDGLALAWQIGMRPLAAHCCVGLARLFHHTDRPDLARDHLAAAATAYREMDMPFWLEQVAAEM
jgi:DNA-binding SARP family transcriptional activator/class 3 adenylate cyclase